MSSPLPVLSAVAALSIALAAQSAPPPVHGTMALEGTMKTFYRGVNTLVVTTKDGVEHVYHFAKDLVVHGGKGNDVAALEGLREGTTVVVHYSPSGADQAVHEVDVVGEGGLQVSEGIVTRIDRRGGEITVRYDNGKTEKFKLTERAAGEAAGPTGKTEAGARIRIYYTDEAGNRVVHFFTPASGGR